jgi:hypothetical protein
MSHIFNDYFHRTKGHYVLQDEIVLRVSESSTSSITQTYSLLLCCWTGRIAYVSPVISSLCNHK